MSTKSDVKAKKAFIIYLQQQGFTGAKIIGQPADIEAWKDGERYYFEIKMTRQANSYFGAATTTEWKAAAENPEKYFFVIAITDSEEKQFRFKVFTPEEFMGYSSIPPFKIFFNINLNSLISQGLDGTCNYSDKDAIDEIVKQMGVVMSDNAQDYQKQPRKKSTKLTPENLQKLIDMYTDLYNKQEEC